MSDNVLRINSTVTLSNGMELPRFGLGVFKSKPGGETESAVRAALERGYRLVDTARIYGNEADVGRAVKEFQDASADNDGDGVFITTKVWNSDQGYDETLRACERSLAELDLEQIDLYLVHWPRPELIKDTWRAMERLQDEGVLRAIGVSNFEPHHLEKLFVNANAPPVVNQVELHPYLQQLEVREYCGLHGIVVEAWSPIARGKILDDPVLAGIAETYGKSPVQVALRWELQQGIITIPKSVKPERIESNADIFDFSLTPAEVERINALDRGEKGRCGPHPDRVDF